MWRACYKGCAPTAHLLPPTGWWIKFYDFVLAGLTAHKDDLETVHFKFLVFMACLIFSCCGVVTSISLYLLGTWLSSATALLGGSIFVLATTHMLWTKRVWFASGSLVYGITFAVVLVTWSFGGTLASNALSTGVTLGPQIALCLGYVHVV